MENHMVKAPLFTSQVTLDHTKAALKMDCRLERAWWFTKEVSEKRELSCIQSKEKRQRIKTLLSLHHRNYLMVKFVNSVKNLHKIQTQLEIHWLPPLGQKVEETQT